VAMPQTICASGSSGRSRRKPYHRAVKLGALAVYDLEGRELQYIEGMLPNNVDLRYGFPIGGESCDIICASNHQDNSILIYRVDTDTRQLVDVADGVLATGVTIYGACMYKSAASGDYYCFVTSRSGKIEQWRLLDNGNGKVSSNLRGLFAWDPRPKAVWPMTKTGFLTSRKKASAYGDTGLNRLMGLKGGCGSHSLEQRPGRRYRRPCHIQDLDGGGYLLASVQGRSAFAVYGRSDNRYLGMFRVGSSADVDGVGETDASTS